MDEDREKRSAKRSGEVDWLSNLPDSLVCQVLLNLPTKDVVKSSVLSTRWRNLWKFVPGLNLDSAEFPEYNTFVSFVDSFLDLNRESCLQSFRLKYYCDEIAEAELTLISRWLKTIVNRKLEHLYVMDQSWDSYDVHIPPTIYTCKTLVSLKLNGLTLPSPKFVSLPNLKAIDLTIVEFADDLALETLISACPVLESLIIERSLSDNTEVLRVRSQSLLNFTLCSDCSYEMVEDLVVTVDAPRLKYLRLSDGRTASFILNNPSLVEADLDTVFNLCFEKYFHPNDLLKRKMIRNFLAGISRVKDMIISSSTLEVIFSYSRCEQLPLFSNLSSLRVDFNDYKWEMLPVFLESCPNLKSLVVRSTRHLEIKAISLLPGSWCLLSSLEYVEIERPLKGDAKEMELVSYLLENSKILKKITLCLDDVSKEKGESDILKELIFIPRLSSLCKVFVR